MSSHYLSVEGLNKQFVKGRETTDVLRDVNLKVNKGEYVSIIGHSGCGKSTVLNIIAGLIQPTTGCVILDHKEITHPGPDRAVVFQNHSLLPWLSVYDNVYLAVKKTFRRTKSKAELKAWTEHNLELVNMSHALNKLPAEISGGMKQRVGIARALSMEPKVLLLDEPFGALDALTRAHLQDEVMRIHNQLQNTVIMITHDVDEAVLLSDHIVMMTNGPAATIGEILTIDLPHPRDRLAMADSPRYNEYRAAVLRFLYARSTLNDAASPGKPPKNKANSAPPQPATGRRLTESTVEIDEEIASSTPSQPAKVREREKVSV